MVVLGILYLLISDMYYDTCSANDRHNRRRFDDIRLDKKLATHSWEFPVDIIIFVIATFYTYNVATQ